jgi:DNA polymerase III subunit epsilon
MVRHDAAVVAANAGCQVDGNVTKHTTLLVVGDQDIRKLAGHEKSLKHRKAEELIGHGQRIRIVGESDFKSIVVQKGRTV